MALEGEAVGRREALIRVLRVGGLGAAATGLGFWLNSRSRYPEEPTTPYVKRSHAVPSDSSLPEMAVVQGEDPRKLLRRAITELGGIGRFIARGDVVVIKPNVSWDRTPEQAANTNPLVVAEMVRLCLEANAKTVIVTDVSINEPHRCFQRSGIAEAARNEGARVLLAEPRLFRRVNLRGALLGEWPVLEPFLSADKLINIPIAKSHSLTGVTLGFKNWYGILGGQRQRLHQRIHESLADLGDFARPTLTVLDAYRVLLRNGPGGGSLEDVALKKTLIAGTDPVALDAYAAEAYWSLGADDLLFLQLAAKRGLGTLVFENLATRVVAV
jgi:uncharacterized protein (DUF362 family)